MIPRLLHLCYHWQPLPAWARRNVAEWRERNPGWEVRCWDHEPADLPAELRQALRWAPSYRFRSDLVRYWLLQQHGGVYADLDTRPLRPLDDAVRTPGCFLIEHAAATPHVDNFFMGAAAGHPALATAMARCLAYRSWRDPACYFGTVNAFLDEQGRLSAGVTVLPAAAAQARQEGEGWAELLAEPRPALSGTAYLKHYQVQGELAPSAQGVHAVVPALVRRDWFVRTQAPDWSPPPDLPRPRPERRAAWAATAILPRGMVATLGPKLAAAVAAAGGSLAVEPATTAHYRRFFLQARHGIIWGCKLSHRQYVANQRNVLFLENGLLHQRHGVWLDAGGYWTDSDLVRRREWEQAPTPAELAALARHVEHAWRVAPFAGGDPAGPILLALQHRRDAPCRHYFPAGRLHDPLEMAIWLLRKHFRQRRTVLVRPHPRFLAEFERERAKYVRHFAEGYRLDASPDIYALLPRCAAVVTVNSTLATEALAFGVPVATLGYGTFTGAGVTLECADDPARLGRLLEWRADRGKVEAYLGAVLRHQFPYHGTAAALAAHPAFQSWAARCRQGRN